MNLTTNDLLIVIGEQTLEIKVLTIQNEAMTKRLKELEPATPFIPKVVEEPNG